MFSGQCYCGKSRITLREAPEIVTYCHCADCRRISGAPVSAFAAFARHVVEVSPTPKGVSVNPGVPRYFCADCGTHMLATYDYLPNQAYVPVGILDETASLAPERHSHGDSQVSWLHLDDGLPRSKGSGRDALLGDS